MIDFLMISTRSTKRGVIEVYPKFVIKKSSDLMIRGGDFYAIWVEERGLWSTDEQDALQLIDRELDAFAEDNKTKFNAPLQVMHMWDAESGMIDSWHKYCQKQMRDSFHMLDEKLIFLNTPTSKSDYVSKRLNYPLEKGDISAYDKLMSTLYSPEERRKIEWAIGSIVSGESKKLQKFLVLYGAAGTGKSTVLKIVEQLFDGYYSVFDAKALGSTSNSFALEAFKTNPLVAIQHDGDLSRIEDNTRLNSLVSHELMTVNEKFKSTYANRFKCFLFMGTNKPVRITDAKSGLIRRLIDVSPSGEKLSQKDYNLVMEKIRFELGAIAFHCRDVYLEQPTLYEGYIPITMMGASNDFYNFVSDSFLVFEEENGTSLKAAWEMYRTYCAAANVPYPFSQRIFKEELKNYFYDYKERYSMEDGTRVRSYYSGFRTDRFDEYTKFKKEETSEESSYTIHFDATGPSVLDETISGYLAQYASSKGTPLQPWNKVTTTVSQLDTRRLHYVKFPEDAINHIVIDFDIPDEAGNKSFQRNLEAASKWPPTYAELSKSGAGIHLHYIYTGDATKLSSVYDDHIEVKIFKGGSSLRRQLSKYNSLPISTISAGLPLKGDKSMVNFETLKSEKALRTLIQRNLAKEYHAATKPSVDFIYKILEDAYNSDLKYDVSDMYQKIVVFALNSTNNSEYCLKLVNNMKLKSDEPSTNIPTIHIPVVFFDVEVFPNLLLVNWKLQGKDKPVVRMINPKPSEIEALCHYNLVGFNNRKYDNHILYARMIGKSIEEIYYISKRIIKQESGAFFGEAYNLSYTDIYDFSSSQNRQSLKKWEIQLGLHHQELGLDWDQPVPEEKWVEVAEYCDNDVITTEAVFDHLTADWTARQILADLAGMTVNDTTNALTTRIIFQGNKHPQSEFNYRDLSKPVFNLPQETYDFLAEACPEMMSQTHGPAGSLLPYFEGYKSEYGKNTYKGIDVGSGGLAMGFPGMYSDVALLDIASMHPHSAIAEVIFGVRFTMRFREIVEGRVSIKHEAWDEVNKILDGKLTPYIQKVKDGLMTATDLANALKTAINSVYGLTAARFTNEFRDPRNVDNIVAKRGALFMVDLKEAVEAKGFKVAHIKTDSIKIPNATPEIIQFVMDFGKRYGYTFEHEATYSRMCLVNDAVYIAQYKDGKHAGEWTATGEQFAVPYVFKTLFSKEPIAFNDFCEVKSVQTSLHLDMNEKLPDVTLLEKEFDKWKKTHGTIATSDTKIDYENRIAAGHDYHFVGRVGEFCPIKPGMGGGLLLRKGVDKNGDVKYTAAEGTKGYRWLESEKLRLMDSDVWIDKTYFQKLVDNARDSISQYGDFDWFVSDDSDTPVWKMPCGKESCYICPHFNKDLGEASCAQGYDVSELSESINDFCKR